MKYFYIQCTFHLLWLYSFRKIEIDMLNDSAMRNGIEFRISDFTASLSWVSFTMQIYQVSSLHNCVRQLWRVAAFKIYTVIDEKVELLIVPLTWKLKYALRGKIRSCREYCSITIGQISVMAENQRVTELKEKARIIYIVSRYTVQENYWRNLECDRPP